MFLTVEFMDKYIGGSWHFELKKVANLESVVNRAKAFSADAVIYSSKDNGKAVILFNKELAKITVISDSFRIKDYNENTCIFSYKKLKVCDLRALDTSNLTNLNAMFENCIFDKLLVDNWDVTNVESAVATFDSTEIKGELDLSTWDLSNCKDTKSMFHFSNIESLKLPKFNPSKLENVSYMFNGAIINEPLSLGSLFNRQLNSKCITSAIFSDKMDLISARRIESLKPDDACIKLTDDEIYIPLKWVNNEDIVPHGQYKNDIITNCIKAKRVVLANLSYTLRISLCSRSKFVNELVIEDSSIEDNTDFCALNNIKSRIVGPPSNKKQLQVILFKKVKFVHCKISVPFRGMNIAREIEVEDCDFELYAHDDLLDQKIIGIDEVNGFTGAAAIEELGRVTKLKQPCYKVIHIDHMRCHLKNSRKYI